MHISGAFSELSEDSPEYAKADIGGEKADIETKIANIAFIGPKTKTHILALYEASFSCDFFGRSFIENSTGLKKTRASEIIQILSEHDIIEPVKGHGKGKYRFKE